MDLGQVVRELQHSRNGITVITEDGCFYEANYVILSVSIGVLQSDLISFRPPLPVRFFFHFFQKKFLFQPFLIFIYLIKIDFYGHVIHIIRTKAVNK
jgi:hypothetical protein